MKFIISSVVKFWNDFLFWSLLAPSYPFFSLWRCGPTRSMASSLTRFLDRTQRRITVGRTPLDEWSARRRDLYLTTHNAHNRQTSMPQVEFEPTISAGERPQTYALDRAATGTGFLSTSTLHKIKTYHYDHWRKALGVLWYDYWWLGGPS